METKYPVAGLKNAIVSDLAWLSGKWYGERQGEPVEEYWSDVAVGTLMGMFRWIRAGQVWFYELITIEQEAEGVVMRIKHFDPPLKGWEEKDESVTFLLVSLRESEAVFLKRNDEKRLWLIYSLESRGTLVSYFEREEEDHKPEEEFRYHRMEARNP
jgi:hypothetical protein